MASAYNRGTDRNPVWWVRYKTPEGKWAAVRAPKADNVVEARRFADEVQRRVDSGLPPVDDAGDAPEPAMVLCGTLMRKWEATLATRSIADDKSRLHRHLLPKWEKVPIGRVDLAACMTWIDEMRAGTAPTAAPADGKPQRGRRARNGALSDATNRHNLNLLSRFFSWAVERGHAAVNPVRLIPTGKRPHQTGKIADAPWIDDDALVRVVISELAEPVNLIFYLCNRAGLRSGEALGLRMSDFGFLADGAIRVRYSYDGPLKEDKRREGKVKRVPAPEDCDAVMAPWLAARRAKGAQPEDLVFPSNPSTGRRKRPEALAAAPQLEERPYRALFLSRNWNQVAARHGLRMTWYQATRHSMVSRNLSRGASLDEVSDAVGHSSPMVTARHYAHFVRKSYSPTLRSGLGLNPAGEAATVIDIATAAKPSR